MASPTTHRGPAHWTGWLPPVLGLALALALGLKAAGWSALPVFALLLLSVQATVHHAEVVAARVGEPFGALILAIAVTVWSFNMLGDGLRDVLDPRLRGSR